MSRYVFKMPDLGEGTVSAEVVEWKVKAGTTGDHEIRATTPGGEVKDSVTVKAGSIFG